MNKTHNNVKYSVSGIVVIHMLLRVNSSYETDSGYFKIPLFSMRLKYKRFTYHGALSWMWFPFKSPELCLKIERQYYLKCLESLINFLIKHILDNSCKLMLKKTVHKPGFCFNSPSTYTLGEGVGFFTWNKKRVTPVFKHFTFLCVLSIYSFKS